VRWALSAGARGGGGLPAFLLSSFFALCDFFEIEIEIEIFWSDFSKYLFGVFELLVQRNGQNADKNKSKGKNDRDFFLFSQLFWQKVFDMEFPQNTVYGVFELPFLRNTQNVTN
jgi:hypothetical protein